MKCKKRFKIVAGSVFAGITIWCVGYATPSLFGVELVERSTAQVIIDGTVPESPEQTQIALFKRGDPNGDGTVDLGAAMGTLGWLFLGGDEPECKKAADVDDDGQVAITDSLAILGFLFLGTEAPQHPYPTCGVDPTEDSLSCERPCSRKNVNEVEVGIIDTQSGAVTAINTGLLRDSFEDGSPITDVRIEKLDGDFYLILESEWHGLIPRRDIVIRGPASSHGISATKLRVDPESRMLYAELKAGVTEWVICKSTCCKGCVAFTTNGGLLDCTSCNTKYNCEDDCEKTTGKSTGGIGIFKPEFMTP